VDGVLRVAEGFARLGDAEALTQALRIADSLARADATGEAQRHVLEVRRRLTPSTALSDPLVALFPDAAVRP
jgi:hypothetical protein